MTGVYWNVHNIYKSRVNDTNSQRTRGGNRGYSYKALTLKVEW